jgi:hypothetical protein
MQISPEIAWRDYGIELERRPTQDQKAWLMQMMQQDIVNGLLNTADAVLLVNTKNVKQAQMIWAYRVKKEKERQSQQRMAEIQAQQQGNMQSAQIAQQAEMQKFQMQADLELRKEQMRIDGELQKEQMRIESAERIAMANNNTKMKVSDNTSNAKQNSTHIAGQSSIMKQQVANQKNNFTSANK